jgi:hypothetical protein
MLYNFDLQNRIGSRKVFHIGNETWRIFKEDRFEEDWVQVLDID